MEAVISISESSTGREEWFTVVTNKQPVNLKMEISKYMSKNKLWKIKDEGNIHKIFRENGIAVHDDYITLKNGDKFIIVIGKKLPVQDVELIPLLS